VSPTDDIWVGPYRINSHVGSCRRYSFMGLTGKFGKFTVYGLPLEQDFTLLYSKYTTNGQTDTKWRENPLKTQVNKREGSEATNSKSSMSTGGTTPSTKHPRLSNKNETASLEKSSCIVASKMPSYCWRGCMPCHSGPRSTDPAS
jgi:hypothetical protein